SLALAELNELAVLRVNDGHSRDTSPTPLRGSRELEDPNVSRLVIRAEYLTTRRCRLSQADGMIAIGESITVHDSGTVRFCLGRHCLERGSDGGRLVNVVGGLSVSIHD